MEEYKYPFGSYKKYMDEFLSQFADGEMFYVRLCPGDWVCGCSKKTFYRRLNEEMPEWFLQNCQTFRKEEGTASTFEPVFNSVQQAAWDAALKKYCEDKARTLAEWGTTE